MKFEILVRPEHLNSYKFLFGGYMLLWVDENTYIAAVHDFPSAHLVTRGMDALSFTKGVRNGSILTFDINRVKVGTTSVTYHVQVTAMELPSGDTYEVFQTNVTMCNVTIDGKKAPLPPLHE